MKWTKWQQQVLDLWMINGSEALFDVERRSGKSTICACLSHQENTLVFVPTETHRNELIKLGANPEKVIVVKGMTSFLGKAGMNIVVDEWFELSEDLKDAIDRIQQIYRKPMVGRLGRLLGKKGQKGKYFRFGTSKFRFARQMEEILAVEAEFKGLAQ